MDRRCRREPGLGDPAARAADVKRPLLAELVSGPWRRHIQQIAPMTAGLAIQATRNIRSLPISPWAGLGILGAWAAGMLLVGLAVLNARDA